jgi:hypothetical protein
MSEERIATDAEIDHWPRGPFPFDKRERKLIARIRAADALIDEGAKNGMGMSKAVGMCRAYRKAAAGEGADVE